jgi:uncharacterized membrane protein YkoI
MVALAAVTGIAVQAYAEEKGGKDETVALSQVPQVVQDTINQQAAGGTVGKIEKGDENGTVVYEAEITKDGKKSELTITADGKVKPEDADDKEEKGHGKAEEKDEFVSLSQAPVAVRATIKAQASPDQIVKIVKADENGTVVYEAEIIKDGKKSELTIAADGKILDTENAGEEKEEKGTGKAEEKAGEKDEVVSLSQAPAAVQATIKAQAGDGKIGKIVKGMDNGKTVYEATITKGSKTTDISVDPDGKLLSSEEMTSLKDVPTAVRKTIQAQAGTGEIKTVEKVTVDGKVTYEALVTKDGKDVEIAVTPDGKLQTGAGAKAKEKDEKTKGKDAKD